MCVELSKKEKSFTSLSLKHHKSTQFKLEINVFKAIEEESIDPQLSGLSLDLDSLRGVTGNLCNLEKVTQK